MLGDGLPDGSAHDVRIVVTEPIADAANVGPRLIGSKLLCEQTELRGGFTDTRQTALGGIILVSIGEELLLGQAVDAYRQSRRCCR